jgi:hypothetical protein
VTAYEDVPPGVSDPDGWLSLFVDRALSRATPELVDPLGTSLPLFLRRTHGLVGPGESGKSMLAAHAALTVAARGGRVVILDGEMSAWRWRDRIETMGARSRPELLDLISYVRMGDEDWRLLILDYAPHASLIVCDSLSRYLAQAGVQSENANTEVTRAMTYWTQKVAAAGPAVLLLDHTSKEASSMVSRGASAKFNDLDVSYGLQLDGGSIPGRNEPWQSRLTVEKDRDALIGDRLDRVVTFTSTLTVDGYELEVRWAEPAGQSHRLRGVDREAAIHAKLDALNPPPLTPTEALNRLGGKRQTLWDAFKTWDGRPS